MRVTILWSSLTPYMAALFREMATKCHVDIQLIYQPPITNAPFKDFDISFCAEAREAKDLNVCSLCNDIRSFAPDFIFMSSWNFTIYRRACRRLRKQGIFVVSSMDNQFLGGPKQIFGILTSRWFLKPAIDTFFVAGDRQAVFARMLGYQDVLRGFLSADIDSYLNPVPLVERPANFLFAGRLVKEKGLLELVSAYQRYRERVDHPWSLSIAGDGPLKNIFKGVPGVRILGFVQPNELPKVMAQSRCFILPSHFEPWGVVIHEATAAGLAVISSHFCGAVPMFVRDGVNGYVIPPESMAIARAMKTITEASKEQLQAFSRISRNLATLWSPSIQAHYFLDAVKTRLDIS